MSNPCPYCCEAPDEGKCIAGGCKKCCECGRDLRHLLADPAPVSDMKTVRVRIAVWVNHEGEYFASDTNSNTVDVLVGDAACCLGCEDDNTDMRLSWVTAEVPRPEPPRRGRGGGGRVTDEQMEKAALEAIRMGFNRVGIAEQMGVENLSDRRADRTLQRLRKQGKIEYSGGQWRVTVPMEICTVEKPRR